MNRDEIGEFLYRYYRKRTTSFLANIYKSGITGDSKDIHRTRLDVKRIIALYGLFEMLQPKTFQQKGGAKLFRPLYRQAGKIRETQVNYILLSSSQTHQDEFSAFIFWLKEQEHKAVKKFLEQIKRFRESELEETDKLIHKICYSSSIVKIRQKTESYIRSKALQVKSLQAEAPGEKEIHTIRQQLKAMSTITTLVYTIKPGKRLDMIISEFNKTEMMIGDWHDKVVLRVAIEKFIEAKTPVSSGEMQSLIALKQELAISSLNLIQHFMPEVYQITQDILKESNS
jgi:hypothetical protein